MPDAGRPPCGGDKPQAHLFGIGPQRQTPRSGGEPAHGRSRASPTSCGPAGAGIDPKGGTCTARRTWFPRRRGDRQWDSEAGHPSSFSGTTSEFTRELQAGAGELNKAVSLPWRGLAVRLTRRPGQRGQHHAPTGSFLGRLDQEFLKRNIDVDIVEFEVECGLHVGGGIRGQPWRCSRVPPASVLRVRQGSS